MKFLDLFAGIGGFRLGMESTGHECVGFCEIDKFARTSYKAIHNTEGEVEMHDITTVSDEFIRGIGSVDVICGGFPCQAFSIAGKRKGFEDTRGTLFFEIARFASILRPRYLFLENVKGLLNHEGGATFETILRALDDLGYDVEWQVLNSKDYVPQNRERVFIIGHLRGECTRKIFPFSGNDEPLVELQRQQSSVNTITARYGEAAGVGSYVVESKQQEQVAIPAQDRQGIIVVGNLPGNHDQNSRVYNSRGIAPTLSTMQGGGQEPKILIKEATTKGYAEALPGDSVNISHPNSETRRGRVGKGIANTLLTGEEQAVVTDNYRIRKLTPRECWRLQGFPDWAFDRAKEVNSDSQLYKQAGNSVTVPVIADIAKRL
ncbi:DNA cytosine methyltransferase [Enterococcus lactis]|uniref:DNA cytosine methyltransferase n=1 Tax=Enterococcus lactis TaxID=357441 RepID=UPI0039A5D308